ncbi:MAG: AzlD domain-containing protein [Actinomycetota bacterium]|nr:AzlD domain-containing protein [Actinomycetota bacterium]
MSGTWLVVVLCGAATATIKAAGPVLLGGRTLSFGTANVIGLLGPALLAALVAVNTFGGGDRALTLDARVLGVAAAAIAIWRRAPMLLVVVVAAAVTALARAAG